MKLYLALFVGLIASAAADSCKCNYHIGGCTISTPPPANKACHCKYTGFWSCRGEVRSCVQQDSPRCRNPDKSLATCLQGNGDCKAYRDDCDCAYHDGRCRIVKSAVPHTACHCKSKGFRICRGKIVRCKDANSEKCISPDTSRESCLQGGGDCPPH